MASLRIHYNTTKDQPRRRKRKLSDSPQEPKPKLVKLYNIESKEDNFEESEGSQTTGDEYNVQNQCVNYARMREENLRLNQEFFRQFGVQEAKQNLLSRQSTKKVSHRGLQREKIPVELLPRRSSLRLQHKTPEGIELPPEALVSRASYTSYQPEEHLRPPSGTLDMKEYLYGSSKIENHQQCTRTVKQVEKSTFKPSTADLDRYVKKISTLKLAAEQVAKVVPERSFSVAIHPCESRILAATGDKWGKLGLWDVLCDNNTSLDGVCCYAPHSRPITCLEFPMDSPQKIYSCSYDGTLRCADFTKDVFCEIYSVPEDADILLRNFSFSSTSTMLVSQSDGCVALVDTRTDGCKAERVYELHSKSLRTVSVHPTQSHYFCTAAVDGSLCVWDLRNLKVKKSQYMCKLPHGKSINSAYFSPVSGKYVLSTSMDDKLTIYNTMVIGPGISTKKSLSHNNHTGRWLTGFRATWHPTRDDVFVVGSMNRPREISLFSDSGLRLHSFKDPDYLTSVCSVNVFHPSRDIIVGANSSGRLHVFM